MSYQAQWGWAVVPGSAVPKDTVPVQPAVPMATHRRTPYGPVALWFQAEQQETGLLTHFLWGQEFHLVNIWRTSEQKVWGFQGFTSGPSKIFLHGSEHIVQPLPFQICITGKSNLRESAGKLNSFMVVKKTDLQREATQNILATTHSRAHFLPPWSVWTSFYHLLFRKTEQNTSMCICLQK